MITRVLLYNIIGAASALISPSATRDLTATDDNVLGTVELLEYEDLMGFSATVSIHEAIACCDTNSFDQKTSSATWKLPEDSFIGFYADSDCKGENCWFNIFDHENVTDLYAVESALDNKVSSIIVLKVGAGPLKFVKECVNDT